jgi:hypothetical protein
VRYRWKALRELFRSTRVAIEVPGVPELLLPNSSREGSAVTLRAALGTRTRDAQGFLGSAQGSNTTIPTRIRAVCQQVSTAVLLTCETMMLCPWNKHLRLTVLLFLPYMLVA